MSTITIALPDEQLIELRRMAEIQTFRLRIWLEMVSSRS
jgi:hypothetical protein